MRHLDTGRTLFPRHARDLEGEAHPGLEAVQEVRAGLEQRPPAERPTGFLIENRLRRLSGCVDADEASRVGEERKQTVRRDRERSLDDDEVERSQARPPPCRANPRPRRYSPGVRARSAPPPPRPNPIPARRPSHPWRSELPRHNRIRPRHRGRDRPERPSPPAAFAPRSRARGACVSRRRARATRDRDRRGTRIPERRSAGAAFRETPPTRICRRSRRCAAGR